MDLSENVDSSSCDLKIVALPIEIWLKILKMLKSCEHRNKARLVCKFWRELLNIDCSSEKMLIPEDAHSDPEKWSVLMASQRRKIHYQFVENCGNIDNFDDFFAHRGDLITSLDISACSVSIPRLEMIISYCQYLRMLIIGRIDYDWLRQLCDNDLRHDSLTMLIWRYMNLLDMINGVDHVQCVLPYLKTLEMENLKEFPDAIHLRTLQDMRYNTVIVGNDIHGNQFRINEDNNIYVNIKYAMFTFNSRANTVRTEYRQPYGTTENSLLEFMTLHKNLDHLKINFGSWNLTTLIFPPFDYNFTQSNLRGVEFYGQRTVVLRQCPVLFNNLEKLCLYSCEVENFSPAIIAQMTNMKELSINNISYLAFVAVCEHMPLLEKFKALSCSDFNETLFDIGLQKNLVKLKKLELLKIPGEIWDTEEKPNVEN